MGAVNEVVDHAELEAGARVGTEIIGKSPQAVRMLKFAFNLPTTGWWASRCSPARPRGWRT